MLVTLAGIAVIVYGIAALLVWRFQARFVYYPAEPTRRIEATPSDIGLPFEDIVLTTDDEVELHGWYIPGDGAATVLYFHGNAGNISHRLDSIRLFNQLGLNVFIIDYRGYGRSDGEPTEQGTYRDAMAAWRHLVEDRGVDHNSIVILGRSLGGAIAANLASRVEPAGLVLESTFTSVPAMARQAFPWLPSGLAHIRYDTLSLIGSVSCPVLLMHSPNDNVVPIDHARRLAGAAPPGTRLVELRGGHNDAFFASGETYTDALREFVTAAVATTPAN